MTPTDQAFAAHTLKAPLWSRCVQDGYKGRECGQAENADRAEDRKKNKENNGGGNTHNKDETEAEQRRQCGPSETVRGTEEAVRS